VGHCRLLPPAAGALTPDDVLELLKPQFPYVEADLRRGDEHIDGMIAQFRRTDAPADIIDLWNSRKGKTYFVTIFTRDHEDHGVHFCVAPDEPIFVGFCSPTHEKNGSEIMKQCAEILGYTFSG